MDLAAYFKGAEQRKMYSPSHLVWVSNTPMETNRKEEFLTAVRNGTTPILGQLCYVDDRVFLFDHEVTRRSTRNKNLGRTHKLNMDKVYVPEGGSSVFPLDVSHEKSNITLSGMCDEFTEQREGFRERCAEGCVHQ